MTTLDFLLFCDDAVLRRGDGEERGEAGVREETARGEGGMVVWRKGRTKGGERSGEEEEKKCVERKKSFFFFFSGHHFCCCFTAKKRILSFSLSLSLSLAHRT